MIKRLLMVICIGIILISFSKSSKVEKGENTITMDSCVAKIESLKISNEESYSCCSLQCKDVEIGHFVCMKDCFISIKLVKSLNER